MFIPGVRKQANDCPALPVNLDKEDNHIKFLSIIKKNP